MEENKSQESSFEQTSSTEENRKIKTINSLINLLEEHKMKCVTDEKYKEADQTQNRIDDLQRRRNLIMISKRKKEYEETRNQIRDLFENSVENLSAEYSQKIERIRERYQYTENEMIIRQRKELETLRQKLDKAFPVDPKPSTALRNLRQEYRNLARQGNYAQAAMVKDKSMELEQEERAKWDKLRAGRISYLVSRMVLRHKKEREAHEKKMKSTLDDVKNERDLKVEQVTRNYQNTEKQANNVQNIEIAQLKKGMFGNRKGTISVSNLQASLENKQ